MNREKKRRKKKFNKKLKKNAILDQKSIKKVKNWTK